LLICTLKILGEFVKTLKVAGNFQKSSKLVLTGMGARELLGEQTYGPHPKPGL